MNERFYIKCDEINAWSVHEKNGDVIVFDLLKHDAEQVCRKLNELSDENTGLKKELEQCKYFHKGVMDTASKTLKEHYRFAEEQRRNNIDNVIIYKSYDVLLATVKDIADKIGVELYYE